MYYPNANYMQDLNYYNQTPNYGYCPYGPNGGNQMPMQTQNLNGMYPAVYRIISPVVTQVLATNNYGYLTEDSFDNLVNTVYNIVEKDIPKTNQVTSNNPVSTENSNGGNCTRNASNPNSVSAHVTKNQNSLLRDLIKILILNEILNKRQNQNIPMMMPNTNQQMFM